MVETSTETKIKRILDDAKKETRKGKYYVYEEYKSQIQDIPMSSREYDQTIFQLAKILRV